MPVHLPERRACWNRYYSLPPCRRVAGTRSDRTRADLGRLLTDAGGYRVLASDGTHVGWLDHVRYERRVDHPDEIVVRSRRLLARLAGIAGVHECGTHLEYLRPRVDERQQVRSNGGARQRTRRRYA
jgi:hypothetical protein